MSYWDGHVVNWGRWSRPGGTANLIGPDAVLRAKAAIQSGRVVACGRELVPEEYPPKVAELHGFSERGFEHRMLSAVSYEDRFAAGDRISISVHSLHNTHLDALSHVGHRGSGFDGVATGEMVSLEGGARIGAITDIPPIVTRGMLVDVPRLRKVDYVAPGDWVRPEELEAGAGSAVAGDAVVVRTGRWLAPRPPADEDTADIHGSWPGLHVECVQWAAEHDIALLGTDSTGDTFPLPIPDMTVHIAAEVYVGLPLLHSLDLEELAAACAEAGRWTFLFSVTPLKIPRGTGSPVAPVAVL